MIVKCKPWKSNSQYLELAFFMTQRVPWFNLVLVAINEVRRAAWHPIALLGISWAKKGNSLWLLTTIQQYFYVKPLVQPLFFFSLKKKWEIGDFTENPFFSSPFLFLTLLSNKQEMPKKSNIFFTSAAALPQDICTVCTMP